MINGNKTIFNLPKVEEENMIKLHESELNRVAKTAFVIGTLCGSIVAVVLMTVVDIIKAILS